MSNAPTNKGFVVGGFVHYIPKNELGVVGSIKADGAGCWYHMGGTRAMTPYTIIEPLSIDEVLALTFVNEYAKPSLIERSCRVIEGGDVSDLIDDCDIRIAVIRVVQEHGGQ